MWCRNRAVKTHATLLPQYCLYNVWTWYTIVAYKPSRDRHMLSMHACRRLQSVVLRGTQGRRPRVKPARGPAIDAALAGALGKAGYTADNVVVKEVTETEIPPAHHRRRELLNEAEAPVAPKGRVA